MAEGAPVFLGLNSKGRMVFILLIIFAFPLCWIPFLVGSLKGDPSLA
ncbi:MAG: hypothetical protein ACI9MC_002431 [Kiritimatiellia bacterium]|jgi:hypothetical protein